MSKTYTVKEIMRAFFKADIEGDCTLSGFFKELGVDKDIVKEEARKVFREHEIKSIFDNDEDENQGSEKEEHDDCSSHGATIVKTSVDSDLGKEILNILKKLSGKKECKH